MSAVVAESLKAELLAVAGVASAEVAVGESANPAGVKVSLSPDADARRVGAEVQRILAAHGMRSRFSEAAPETAPVAEQEFPPIPTVAPPVPPEVAPPVPEAPPPVMGEIVPPPAGTAAAVVVESAPPSEVAAQDETPVSIGPAVGVVRSVALEETTTGLGVIVSLDDGRSASRRLVGDADGEDLDGAVVSAVAEATGIPAETLATHWLEIEGGSVVTVVVRRGDGALGAGAGVVRLGRAYAVAMATQAALGI